MRIKPRKRLKRDKPDALEVPLHPNQVWSMDFMADQLTDCRSFRTLNILDDFNREGLTIEIHFSLPSERVVRILNVVISWRGRPSAIRVDNGQEYISATLQVWAAKCGIELMYFQPSKPQKMLISSVITVPSGKNGSANIASRRLNKCRSRQFVGSGLTTTNGPIWE